MTPPAGPRYKLTSLVIDQRPRIEITQDEFEDIGRAVEGLIDIFWMEEIYDALTQNYRAYEEGQVLMTLSHALETSGGWDEIDEARRTCARLLDNLLSSARAFLDALPKRMRAIGGEALKEAFESATHRAYDRSRAYRFMDGLRNYTQHRGSSISSMTFDHKRLAGGLDEMDFKLLYSVRPRLEVTQVEAEFKTKLRPLLHELADDKGLIDITPLVRQYLVELNRVMLETRQLVAPLETQFYATQDAAVARLKAEIGEKSGLHSAVRIAPDEAEQIHYLAVSQRERTGKLRRRNGKIEHITRLQLMS